MPFIDTGEGKIAYDLLDRTNPEIQNPETIVFHHGVGIDRHIWTNWLPHLIDRYRILWFDMRGYGESVVPSADYVWTIERLAKDVLEVADQNDVDKFHFVGESVGGCMGYYLALNHADRLYTIAPCTGPHRGASVDWVAEWRAFISENGMEKWSERMMERRFPEGVLTEEQWQWFHTVQGACSPDSVLGVGEMLVGVDLTDQLGAINTPTFLTSADRSPFVTLAIAMDTRDRIPGAQIQVIPGTRHGVVFSHGDWCARGYRWFLDRQSA